MASNTDLRNKTVVTVISKISEKLPTKDACLVVIYGDQDIGKKFNLNKNIVLIGRSSKNDIQIDHESVSRTHAKIINTGKAILFRDLGSTNGSYVNDEMLNETHLRDGDRIKVGRTIFKFLSGNNIEHAYHEEIYRLTTEDGLTRVYNKRYVMEALEREIGRAHRYNRPLALIMFDIDNFKQINDTFGHLAGDHVLRTMCDAVKGKIRREDLLGRYGGEEFLLVLPEIDRESAITLAEKIRALVEKTLFKFEDSRMPLTISLGVADLSTDTMDALGFIKAVDAKLYEAKNAGRNQVKY